MFLYINTLQLRSSMQDFPPFSSYFLGSLSRGRITRSKAMNTSGQAGAKYENEVNEALILDLYI